ncbi:MAG: aspartyl protease family protein [Candidatus Eisenbacteria bacterium]|nr:aspartyl protease family protein [Candidatus Eisenbacteria bacterium]
MRSRHPAACALALAALLAGAALADWMQPDPSYRDALLEMRSAARDTVGQPPGAARLDTLAVALLRLGRFADAQGLFERVLAESPGDEAAAAGLGKLALFRDDRTRAESLLAIAARTDHEARLDLYALRLRRGEYAAAAELAEEAGQAGRAPLLRLLAEGDGPYAVTAGPEEATLFFVRSYPVPLVRVKLNGQSVLMAVDTGAGDLLLDNSAARRCKVTVFPEQTTTFWSGSHMAVKNALVSRLDLGGFRVERVPAGVLSLHRWSLEVNPVSEPVAGVIGLNLLRRFSPTLDFEAHRLELRRPGRVAPAAGVAGTLAPAGRVPFELWGENELMVYGSLNGGRRMALVVQSGVPGCGVGAPREVFDEVGVKPGMVARAMKGAGAWLQGRPWAQVMVPTVSVGPIVRDKVPGWSGALDPGELWRHGVRRDALLSNDFFRGQRVTLDWERRELVFEGD